jgi:PAB1-binding protein PBP1
MHDRIEVVTDYKHLQIREITDSGGYHRRVITPDMDVSGEVQEIKDRAEELWTDEVKTAWTTFQAEQEAQMNPENT